MEWWTYGLSDFLMFSPRVYAGLVATYNAAAWPAQVAALVAGAALLGLAARTRLPLALLALAWMATGWAFHWSRYADIFLAAPWLAAACGLQALLCLAALLLPRGEPPAPARRSGLLVMAAGLLAVPLATGLAAHDWRQAQVFGLMPDPTALVTLGWLLANRTLPAWARIALAVWPAVSLLIGVATWVALAQ